MKHNLELRTAKPFESYEWVSKRMGTFEKELMETIKEKLIPINFIDDKGAIRQLIQQIIGIEQVDIGYIEWNRFNDGLYIRELIISEEYQRKGIGRQCIELMKELEGLEWIALEFTEESKPFWLRLGFVDDVERPEQVVLNLKSDKHTR